MILIFLGPPGAGKGTQAKCIAKEFNIPHLSTGDILRFQLENNNEQTKQIKKNMDSGQLVTDEILNSIISNRICQKDCNNGFILDGYPRTINQAIFLEDQLKKNSLNIDYIFEISIEDTIVISRINNRAVIEKRVDDSDVTIKTRLFKYYEDTKPVSNFYQKKYGLIYKTIDGNQKIEELNSKLLKLLKKH